jgi:hypothetical protein
MVSRFFDWLQFFKLTNNGHFIELIDYTEKIQFATSQRIQLFKLQSSLHLYLSRCQERGETSRDIIFNFILNTREHFTPYPRFTRSGKTRICLLKSRKAYFTPYPRSTRSGKTRIWCLKHILEKNRSSVRPSIRPSVRPSVSAFYPNPSMTVALVYFYPHLGYPSAFILNFNR